jgi:hypothetical protein
LAGVKALIFTILVIVFGLMFFFYRRRLKLAVMVAGGLYLGVIVGRFVFLREEVDRFEQLGLTIGALAGVWLVVNVLTELVRRHRARRVRR